MSKKKVEVEEVEVTEEKEPFTIKVLAQVILSKDLKNYFSKEKQINSTYKRGDIIKDVHPDYHKRFANFPKHIQIIKTLKSEQ